MHVSTLLTCQPFLQNPQVCHVYIHKERTQMLKKQLQVLNRWVFRVVLNTVVDWMSLISQGRTPDRKSSLGKRTTSKCFGQRTWKPHCTSKPGYLKLCTVHKNCVQLFLSSHHFYHETWKQTKVLSLVSASTHFKLILISTSDHFYQKHSSHIMSLVYWCLGITWSMWFKFLSFCGQLG